MARALVHDEAAAEDLVQDGWLAALHARPSGDRPIRSWLRRVLRNRASNQAREQRRRDAREAAVGAGIVSDTVSHSPEDLVERLRMQRLLADLVMALDEPLRETLLLRYYEGLSGADIARRLAAPEGTVRRRLKEALDRLRAELADWEQKHGRSWRLVLAPLVASEAPLAIGPAVVTAAASKTVLSAPIVGAVALAVAAAIAAAYIVRNGADKAIATASPDDRTSAQQGDFAGGRRGLTAENAAAGSTAKPSRKPAAALPRFRTTAPFPTSELPAVRGGGNPGETTITGSLDKDVILDVIRRHINEVKFCYEPELATNPGLEGHVEVRFTVAAIGNVVASVLQGTTIGNRKVEVCIVQAVRRWEFPKPADGQIATVTHSFVLTPGTGAANTPGPASSGPATPSDPTRSNAGTLQPGEKKAGVPIQVQSGLRITGRVVEHGTNRPLAGATVSAMDVGSARGAATAGADAAFMLVAAPRGDTVRLFVRLDETRYVSENKEVPVKPGQTSVDVGTIKLLPGNVRERLEAPDRGYSGVFVRNENGRAVLSAPEPDSPALRAGLRAGDFLISIEGRPSADLGSGALNFLLTGKVGTSVSLVVETPGTAPRTVTLTREQTWSSRRQGRPSPTR